MKTVINSDLYQTSDLSLAAAISLCYPVDGIDKTNNSRVVFLFRREDGLENYVEAFWKRELKVDPLTYFNQIKIIKSRIYEK